MSDGKINMTIDSDMQQVQHVGEAIRCLASHLELVGVKPSSVELAVVEAVNNSIEHAYKLKAGNLVDVAVEYSSDRLNIRISDYGAPMPKSIAGDLSSKVAMPDVHEGLEAVPESGWGMQLLKSLCDDISYKRINSCNTLSLSFKLASVTA